jgi:hypothetical protein
MPSIRRNRFDYQQGDPYRTRNNQSKKLPRRFVRRPTQDERSQGINSGIEFVAYPEKPVQLRFIQRRRTEWIKSGFMTPYALRERLGFDWSLSELPQYWSGEKVPRSQMYKFTHKYLPGYSTPYIPVHSYGDLADIAEQFKQLANNERESVDVSMSVVRRNPELLVYVFNLLPLQDKFIIVASGNGQSQGFTLSDSNRSSLAKQLINQSEQTETANNSSGLIVDFMVKFDSFTIYRQKQKHQYKFRNGAFWKHTFKPTVDPTFALMFERYGIYTETNHKNYLSPDGDMENCLVKALRLAGVPEELLHTVRAQHYGHYISEKKLHDVARIVNRNLRLLSNNSTNNQRTYPREGDKLKGELETLPGDEIQLGLVNDHYFLNESMDVCNYSFEHFHKDCMQTKEWWRVYNKRGRRANFEKEPSRRQSSFKIINRLYELEETFFDAMVLDDELLKTIHYDDDNFNFDSVLDASETKPYMSPQDVIDYQTNYIDKSIKQFGAKPKVVFFDYECYQKQMHINGKDKNIFQEYMVSYVTEQDETATFRSGEDMLKELAETYLKQLGGSLPRHTQTNTHPPLILYAHNATYDYRFICKHLKFESVLERDGKLFRCQGRFYLGKNRWCSVQIRDSMNFFAQTKLSKLPSMFGLDDVEKEVMPYTLYTEETIKQQFIPLSTCKQHCKGRDRKQFVANCKDWGLLQDGKVDIIKYSQIYCEQDCRVLKQAFYAFRKLIQKVCTYDVDGEQGSLDPLAYLTIQTMTDHYYTVCGAYKDVYEVSGVTRMFLQQAYVGGRCMMRKNQKQKVTKKRVADIDAVSLYPSALVRMPGLLKGKPKQLKPNELNQKFLHSVDGYYVRIKILSVGKKLDFPVVSYTDEHDKRHWTNELRDKEITVDKYTLEDMVNFQNIKYKIICGLYFNDGYNPIEREVTNRLFEERKKAKKTKNQGLQILYKLMLNSAYGKTAMKPRDVDVKYVTKRDWPVFLSRQYHQIKSWNETYDGDYRVRMKMPTANHFNRVHIAAMVTSMSKRIVNEVLCVAQDNDLPCYYTDTDSIHMLYDHMQKLAKKFEEKYKRKLIGKELGQFHNDFEMDGCVEVWSDCFIANGKKCYVDRLVGKMKDGTIVSNGDYHARCKGVPGHALEGASKVLGKNLIEMYDYLYNGGMIEFNKCLESDGEGLRTKFKFHNNKQVEALNKSSSGVKRCIYFGDKEGREEAYKKRWKAY